MTVLWFNLAFVYLTSTLSRYYARPPTLQDVIKPRLLYVVIALVTMVLVAGLRNNIGDTFYYMHAYRLNEYTWEHLKSGKDVGFIMFQMILQVFSSDPQILIFVTALITNSLIVMILYKYSRAFELSVYVYITSGLFLVSMNGIRQFLAAAIIFAATKYLFDGNWMRYMLFVLLASTIHQSALILIPIYFIVRRKAWTLTTMTFLLFSILVVIGYNQFSSMLFSAIEGTQYGHYQSFSEGGANIARVFVAAIPLIIAYVGRHKLRTLFPNIDYIVNMSLINFFFMVISTQNWIFARFSIYFGLYQLILIAWMIKLVREKDEKLVYLSILVFYFIFYYYEVVITFGTQYSSKYINF